MPTLLKNLMLEELSLVDRPANAQAMVSLFKRDDSQEEEMTETLEKMGYDEAKIKAYMEEQGCGRKEAMMALNMKEEAPMEKSEEATESQERSQVEALKAENELLRKSLIENGFVIKADSVEKKEQVETIEVGGEMVVKSDIPAPVLKALEEAAVEKRMVELRKRAEADLPHFDLEVAMALLEKLDLEDEKVLEALKGADAAFAAVMDEVGEKAVDADMTDPQAKLDKMVQAHSAEHGVNKYDAFDAISKTAEGKALIAKTYEKDV